MIAEQSLWISKLYTPFSLRYFDENGINFHENEIYD